MKALHREVAPPLSREDEDKVPRALIPAIEALSRAQELYDAYVNNTSEPKPTLTILSPEGIALITTNLELAHKIIALVDSYNVEPAAPSQGRPN